MLLSSAIYMNKRMKKVASGDNGRGKMGLKKIQNAARYIYIYNTCMYINIVKVLGCREVEC